MSKPEKCPFYINGKCSSDYGGEETLDCLTKNYTKCDIYSIEYLERHNALPLQCPLVIDCRDAVGDFRDDRCFNLDVMDYCGGYRRCPIFSKWFYSGQKVTEEVKELMKRLLKNKPIPKELIKPR
jgi:hypothetical protein